MTQEIEGLRSELKTILADLMSQVHLSEDKLLVVGCSTSEVIGKRIGTAGTVEVAEMIFTEFKKFQEQTGVQLAFQCCEHLNRALVVEHATASKYHFEQVTVTPVRTAGGAMATFAYEHMNDAVVVEFIKADVGIDIGDTFIGMHLKHVAVPIRSSIKNLGSAHVTIATTRPKLIGGERAVYPKKEINKKC